MTTIEPVYAFQIDSDQFCYECPKCFDKYKKDGKTPYKRAKHTIHRHGSNGNLQNRTETRISHCRFGDRRQVTIIIDDNTKRL